MWASTRSSSGDQVCFSAALVGDEVRVSIVVSVVGADADTVAGAGAEEDVDEDLGGMLNSSPSQGTMRSEGKRSTPPLAEPSDLPRPLKKRRMSMASCQT